MTAAPSRGVERLRRSREFTRVMRRGRRSRHRLVSLATMKNGLPHNRLGLAVGRRVGNAVVRNRTKRRLREIFRALPLEQGYDIVAIAEPPSAYASFWDLQEAVERCCRRSSILRQPVLDRHGRAGEQPR